MPRLCCSLALFCCAIASAQSLTVSVVDEHTGRPLKNVPVSIRYNFMEPRRALKGEFKTVKAGLDGRAVFPDVHIPAGGFSVSVFSMGYRSAELEPVFFPQGTDRQLMNPQFTSLPAQITIRAHKNTLGNPCAGA